MMKQKPRLAISGSSLPLHFFFCCRQRSSAPRTTSDQMPPETTAPANQAQLPPSPPNASLPTETRRDQPQLPLTARRPTITLALAGIYEDEALATDRPEYVTRAIEEYKTALNADPDSPQLNDGLADLYFRSGRIHEAEVTARALLKNSPNDVDAHKLLGRIYLRQLERGRTAYRSTSPSGNILDLAIAEYEKIVALAAQERRGPHGSGPALHRQARSQKSRRGVQDRAGHRARVGRSGAQPGPPLRRKRRPAACRQGD